MSERAGEVRLWGPAQFSAFLDTSAREIFGCSGTAFMERWNHDGWGGHPKAAVARDLACVLPLVRRAPGRRPRCPSRDPGVGTPCVRDEDHPLPHVGPDGEEWIVGIRCRIGAPGLAPAVCGRLDGHEPPCAPIYRDHPPAIDTGGGPAPAPSAAAPPEPQTEEPPASTKPSPPRARGVCICGRPRTEHGPRFTDGCEASGCKRYTSTITAGGRR